MKTVWILEYGQSYNTIDRDLYTNIEGVYENREKAMIAVKDMQETMDWRGLKESWKNTTSENMWESDEFYMSIEEWEVV